MTKRKIYVASFLQYFCKFSRSLKLFTIKMFLERPHNIKVKNLLSVNFYFLISGIQNWSQSNPEHLSKGKQCPLQVMISGCWECLERTSVTDSSHLVMNFKFPCKPPLSRSPPFSLDWEGDFRPNRDQWDSKKIFFKLKLLGKRNTLWLSCLSVKKLLKHSHCRGKLNRDRGKKSSPIDILWELRSSYP